MLVVLLLGGCRVGTVQSVETPPPRATASVAAESASAYPAPATAVSPTDYPALRPADPASDETASTATPEPDRYTYRIVHTWPHDPQAFTQGLIIDENGTMYEGTGLYGRSSLRRVDWETGQVLQSIQLPEQYFGEGITLWDDRIIQLTWRENRGFVYDKDTFELLEEFTYPHEGWGIIHDGVRLIVSDGTATLYFWDPETLEEIGRVEVYDDDGPVVRLNELEYVEGEVWANIWQTDRVARIDPETGRVNSYVDFTGLLSDIELSEPVDVLNGMAYDARNGRFFITGKLWPALFEVEVVPGS